MAFSVDDIFKNTLFLLRKAEAGGVSATELGLAWNSEQNSYQSDLLGRFQRQSNGKDVQDTGLIENETIMTKLKPFITPATVTVASGIAVPPPRLVYTLALRTNNTKIFQVSHDSLWALTQDVIDPPSVANNSYYYAEYAGQFKIFPSTVSTIDIDYIALPIPIVWAYTLDGNNRQVYNPAASVQPQWDDNTIVEITRRTLVSFGVSFKDQDFEGFGKNTVITGNP